MFACAESCTGGLLSSRMTALPGASDVFWGSAVTYSNRAKMAFLDVPLTCIDSYGAVSGKVALAMVEGLVLRSGVSLAASITGVAGPGGGTERAPVGTVWFGLAARESNIALRMNFSGTRAQIQRSAANAALVLTKKWWESNMDLDSLRSLADNNGKPLVEAFEFPLPPPSNTF